MIQLRDLAVLDDISRLAKTPLWETLKAEAEKKLAKHELTISQLIFRTRSPVDPIEIEYYRGFRQGVKYVLDGLPNSALAELERRLEHLDQDNERGE